MRRKHRWNLKIFCPHEETIKFSALEQSLVARLERRDHSAFGMTTDIKGHPEFWHYCGHKAERCFDAVCSQSNLAQNSDLITRTSLTNASTKSSSSVPAGYKNL